MRKAYAMLLHFRVQSVLLSANRTALTLQQVEWGKWADPESDESDWITTGPDDPDAENTTDFSSGKLTELRFDGACEWVPGDMLSIEVTPSR